MSWWNDNIKPHIDAGFANCDPEYLDAAVEAALVLSTLQPIYQAPSITALVETVHPGLWPRADKIQSEAEQRNNRASVSGKVATWFGDQMPTKAPVRRVLRRKTHDKVLEYRSYWYGQRDILLQQPYVDAFYALVADYAARSAKRRKL